MSPEGFRGGMPIVDAKQLAERLGVEQQESPRRSDPWPVTSATVEFFKAGDSAHSFVALDGELIPITRPVSIPEDVKDGESFYIRLTFTHRNPGV